MKKIIGLLLMVFLASCKDSATDTPSEDTIQDLPLESIISSIKLSNDNVYFNFSDGLYFVENHNFDELYCIGFNHLAVGFSNAPKGIDLALLPNGVLFSTEGELFDEGFIVKEYNDETFNQQGKYHNGSLTTTLMVDNRYSEGVKYSKDGENWSILIDDLKVIRPDTRYLWDLQFIDNENHAVALFDARVGGDFIAVFEQGQWNPVVSDTEVTRLLYVGDKLLGLSYQVIRVLDTATGLTLNEFNTEGMEYVSILANTLVFTDGNANYQFDLDTLMLKKYNVPKEIGLITSIEKNKDAIYYGTSNGIWLFKNNEFKQLFNIENYLDTGWCSLAPIKKTDE